MTNLKDKKTGKEKKPRIRVAGLFFSSMKGSYLMFAFTLFTMSTGMFLYYFVPQIMRFVIDSVIGGKEPDSMVAWIVRLFGGMDYIKSHLYIIGIIVVGVTFFQSTAAFFRRACASQTGEIVSKNLKDRMFRHVLSLPFSWHSQIKTGDIIQRAVQDSDLVKAYVSDHLTEALRTIAMLIIGAAMMFLMDWRMTLIALSFFPVVMLVSSILSPRISRHFEATDEAEGLLTAKLQENLTGIRVVRAFGRQAEELAQYDEANQKFISRWKKFTNTVSAHWGSGDLLPALQKIVMLTVGAYMVVAGEMEIGELLAFLTYNAAIVWPVRNLGRILAETGKLNASLRRIKEVLNAEPEQDTAGGLDHAITGEIEFRNVSFGYDGMRKVLDGVSFKVKKGSSLGIIGGTGSGKSTLVQLINRLYDPDEGEILLSGADICTLNKGHVRRNVGLILQEPFLFSKTIRENIELAAGGIEEEALREAIMIASLDSTIAEMKAGLDTVVGEKGVTLSGGQKQRLVIARTLVLNTPIIIFDDSLSAVDTETDFNIRNSLMQNLRGTTTILISHRISSLMHADNIIVLDNGRISDQGTHTELIAREGIYKTLYGLQTEIAEEEKEFTKKGGGET